jgi:hypothetical protein
MSVPSTPVAPKVPITLDDLRHKALAIRDDVTDEAKEVAQRRGTQIAVGVVAVVALTIGLAYLLGTRAGKANAAPTPRALA